MELDPNSTEFVSVDLFPCGPTTVALSTPDTFGLGVDSRGR